MHEGMNPLFLRLSVCLILFHTYTITPKYQQQNYTNLLSTVFGLFDRYKLLIQPTML